MEQTEILLKPGQQIKPYVPNEVLLDLVLRLYNLEVTSVKELNSYDDKNFHIKVFSNISHIFIRNNFCNLQFSFG